MIGSKMSSALNTQINAETWSAFLYLSMSMAAAEMCWRGAAHWFRKQYEEEMQHAFKIIDYMEDQSAHVELRPIREFPTAWESLVRMFEEALEHEKRVTNMIHNLCELATAEHDHATAVFLHWFVSEQVEEEETITAIIERMRLVGDDYTALFFQDVELSERI